MQTVRQVLANTQVDPPDVQADMPLHALGLDSLDVAEMFVAFEELAGGEIDTRSVSSQMTVGDLVSLRCLRK